MCVLIVSVLDWTADLSSFIEENHEYKIESRKVQHMQQSRPGAPSQDLMSYWGG